MTPAHEKVNSAFTLIELLVVIAVISLLLAIMLPVLGRVRSLANLTTCKSNLKQIAFAWQMYFDDNEGRFYQDINSNMIYGGWKGTYFPLEPRPLNKYLSLPLIPESMQEAKVFKCISDDGSRIQPIYDSVGTSYQTNILLVGQSRFGSLPDTQLDEEINLRLEGLKITSVSNPDRLILIGDYTWGSQWVPYYPVGVPWHGRCCYYSLAFLDGHVDYLKITKGLFVADSYCVLPFSELYEIALNDQEAQPCPFCDTNE